MFKACIQLCHTLFRVPYLIESPQVHRLELLPDRVQVHSSQNGERDQGDKRSQLLVLPTGRAQPDRDCQANIVGYHSLRLPKQKQERLERGSGTFGQVIQNLVKGRFVLVKGRFDLADEEVK